MSFNSLPKESKFSIKIHMTLLEYEFFSIPNLLTFLVVLFMLLGAWMKPKTSTRSTSNLPPGPWKLPLIGNMHQLSGSLPHHRLRDLAKKYGPLMHLQLGEISNIVISSTQTAKEVMKNHDINFAQRPCPLAARIITYNYRDIAFAPYGDYWRQLRKICTLELLSAKRVQAFRSIREEEVSNLVRSISSSAGSPINLTKMVFALSNDITARSAFGGTCKNQEAFVAVVTKLSKLVAGFSLADVFPSIKILQVLNGMGSELERMGQEVDKILARVIEEHRARRGIGKTLDEALDLVHVLLNFQENGDLQFPLTDDNIKAVIMDIFFAGSDPSATTVEWAMSEILRNPRVLEKAQREVRQVFHQRGDVDEAGLHELEYLKLVIKETLRLHPPVPLLLPRECRESCKINVHDIPVGSHVIVNAWAIGRDKSVWNEAECFYPERFLDSSVDYKGGNFELIPFGAGRRMCPGTSFGIAVVELSLAQLLYHFNWKLPNGIENTDLEMTEAFGVVVRRKDDLHLIPTPYHSGSEDKTSV